VGLGTDGGISGIELSEAYVKQHRRFVEDRIQAGVSAPGESPDVFNIIPEYNDPRRFATLANDLVHRGWTSGRIEKILGRNFSRLFGEVWQA
jgi:membrane dipeptidase